ncbi:MAG TPA: glycoside hydrolase family 9 protein [Candidatus Angelobacter sp.]|nr:glycoside hydrolase family 9 protein [Candidatus Angelobacter sp.]
MITKRVALRFLAAALSQADRIFRRCEPSFALVFGLIILLGTLRAKATDAIDPTLQIPKIGDNFLHILSPNLLELVRINTKQPDSSTVDSWNWVDTNGDFTPPDMSSVKVVINGQTNSVAGIGFKRRPLYAPQAERDLRIGNYLYLQLSQNISDGQSVRVINDGTVWPTNMIFAATADPLRYTPAIHVNQEGYLPNYPKKAMVGYYLGNLGELPVLTNTFLLVDAQSGATVYQGTLSRRPDYGYPYTPAPYQMVYQADFGSFTTPGEYRVIVPGMGGSLPFRIDEGIAMDFARTYALGMYEQRSGTNVAMPFTRFTHGIDHTSPASVPTNASDPYVFTWQTISNYASQVNSDNPPQEAPLLTNTAAQLYPFVNPGPVEVSGGHFEAGDYNRVTYNSAQLIHVLVFSLDSLPGVAGLDNLGIPESGDGISDVMQEAKWEADFLAKMQDTDGGFYYSVYPLNREYESNVLPENGDPQVVWPKNTVSTAAAVAALAQCASSPHFKQAYPAAAANYLAKAKLGWQFLTNAIAKHGSAGAYQDIQHFGDDFTDKDEIAWAACELYLATGDPQYQQKLFQYFPDPTDPATMMWGWWRMYACYGNAIRDYATAVSSGRLQSSEIDSDYLAKCITTITNCGNDNLYWSQESAYGSSLPENTKHALSAGWYFSPVQAFDLVVAQLFNPNPAYVDAILMNVNYEGGCNPVNTTYITGLGWKRQREVVDQYSENDRHTLPKDGVPISNMQAGFVWTFTYGWEMSPLCFPSDGAQTAPYPMYDRWCDFFNVTTEASTTDTARSFATTAWLAAQTSLATQPWRSTNATIVAPTNLKLPGQPLTVSLNVADTNLSGAKIVWEGLGQDPMFDGTSHTFTAPSVEGPAWVEAEVQWPDGRRAFATNSVTISTNAPPLLTLPSVTGAGVSFSLIGAPLGNYVIEASTDLAHWQPVCTNALPISGLLQIEDSAVDPQRYYRAVKAQ